ncbi:MAG: SH3 domain-containing protein, partial [Aestuariivirgaceae bacterium]
MTNRISLPQLLVCASLYFAFIPLSMAAGPKVPPVDEAAQDPTFLTYRDKLLDAIVRRDVDYVVKQAAGDVKLSFGGSFGRKDFRKNLTLSEKDLADEYKHRAAEMREGYWDALEEVFRMGGRFTATNVFEAPYTWTAKLPDDSDPFTTYLITNTTAPLRHRPSKYSTIIDILAYDVVTGVAGGEGTKFQKIKLASGTEGFVHEDDLRSS